MPHTTLNKYLKPQRGWMRFAVAPTDSVTVADAIDHVTIAMRTAGASGRPGEQLRPREPDAARDLQQRHRGFFLVMLVLSSVGLMVGGVGVVAIMMISVTERTREIGVRKALGATRGEILFQFLVEAATLTVLGGVSGMALGAHRVGVDHASRRSPPPSRSGRWPRPRGVRPDRHPVRDLPRQQGGATRSGGGVAVRVGAP
jgi:putative ABC transport system permease protein